MKSDLGYSLQTLPGIFDGHFFRVPDYQRGYSWDQEQVLDLMEDLEHLHLAADGNNHFTGSLVVTWNSENRRYDIVDGQQRMTTIVILMSCLCRRIEDADLRARIKERYLTRGGIGNEQPVLLLAKNAQDFFRNAVIEADVSSVDQKKSKTHDKIEAAQKAIDEWLTDHDAETTELARDLVNIAESRLGLLVYNPESNAEIGIMFEVINNRGKPLSTLEKVKNYLIYVATKLNAETLRNRVNGAWEKVLEHLHVAGKISVQDESGFLRAVSIVFFRLDKKQSSNVYGELRHNHLNLEEILKDKEPWNKAIERIQRFVQFMENSAYWYRAIFNRSGLSLNEDLEDLLDRIKAQDQHANILPLYLALMVKNQDRDGIKRQRLLKLIEIFNFRVYISPNSRYSNWLQGPMYRLAWQYYHGQDLWDVEPGSRYDNNLEAQVERSLVYLAVLRSGATDKAMETRLNSWEQDNYDFAQWGGLKYFLMCYEAKLNPKRRIRVDEILSMRNKRRTGDYYSVEHIWAVEHEKNVYDQPKDVFQKRRLGNFVLLELNLNIAASNKDVRNKIETYRIGKKADNGSQAIERSKLAQVTELIVIYDEQIKKIDSYKFDDGRYRPFRELHELIGSEREDKFMKFMKEEWSMKDYDGHDEFERQANQHLEP